MNFLDTTCWAEIKANKPLAGIEKEIIEMLDALFLYAVCWEREEGSSRCHPTRKDRNFKGRSNPDGTKPYTKDATGRQRVQMARHVRKLGVDAFDDDAKEIRRLTYTPEPFRLVEIPKFREDGSEKGMREIGIPAYMDRVVMEALRQILERRLDSYLPKGAHGYRANKVDGTHAPYTGHEGTSRGATKAVALGIAKGAYSGLPFVTKVDVVSAFTNVNRDRLRDLWKQAGVINDECINMLIRCCGTHLVGDDGEIKQIEGIAMGSPISPLIWTFYSTALHTILPPKGERTEMDVLINSYADDFWILGSKAEAVCQAVSLMNRRATRLGLTLKWDSGGVVDLRTLEGDPEGYRVLKQNTIRVHRDKTERFRFEVSESRKDSPTKRTGVPPTERKEAHCVGSRQTPVTEDIKGSTVSAPALRAQEKGRPEMDSSTGLGRLGEKSCTEAVELIEESPDGQSGMRSSAGVGTSAFSNDRSDTRCDLFGEHTAGHELTRKDLNLGSRSPMVGSLVHPEVSLKDGQGDQVSGSASALLSIFCKEMDDSGDFVSGKELESSLSGLASLSLTCTPEGPNRFPDSVSPSTEIRTNSIVSEGSTPRNGSRAPVEIIAVCSENRSKKKGERGEASVDLSPLHLDPTASVSRLRREWRSASARWRRSSVNEIHMKIPMSLVGKVWPNIPGLLGEPDQNQLEMGREGDDHWVFNGSRVDPSGAVLHLHLKAHPKVSKRPAPPKPSRLTGWHVVVGKAVGRTGNKRVHARYFRVDGVRDGLDPLVAVLVPEGWLSEVTQKGRCSSGAVEVATAKARVLFRALQRLSRDGRPLHLWGVSKDLLPPPDGQRMQVRPVALHDPVKAVQRDLAARRKAGEVVHHPANRRSRIYQEAWVMGALEEPESV